MNPRLTQLQIRRGARSTLTALTLLSATLSASAAPAPAHHAWAATPPMGWNSFDAYGAEITEIQAKAQADVMADKLLPHGWKIFTVDIQWYDPAARGYELSKSPKFTMDAHGRLLPAVERFPSAANGAGFKPLADYVHAKGLKFGIHLMRGIPRQAVAENTPILGSDARAADIAVTSSTCSWNADMFGVDATKPGGQAYYDSLIALYASWDVDFIKVDDLSQPYDDVQLAEVEAIRKAIDKTGRPIVLSTSPGATPLARGEHVAAHANMWRISQDFWDKWPALRHQFKLLHDWTPFRAPGAWPDADMLPLGIISFGRTTQFTPDEQRTMMTLWSIARSPLILGADMTKLDEATLALLTNDEVLAVNQSSEANRQLFEKGDLIAWVADVPESKDKYLAVFNTGDAGIAHKDGDTAVTTSATVRVPLADLGFSGEVKVRDLWSHTNLAPAKGEISAEVPAHGARLFRVGTR